MPKKSPSAGAASLRGGVPSHPSRPVERLEARALCSVSLDAAGYTVVAPENGDRIVYVSSSSGNNVNDGSAPDRAVRSLSAGVDLLRDGRGDQLLLRRGDTWYGGLPGWRKSGASADRPMVVGAYGSGDRPAVLTSGSSAGFFAGLSSAPRIDHLVIQGVRFAATARDPASPDFRPDAVDNGGYGIQWFAGGTDLLIEDCEVSHFSNNVAIQAGTGSLADVRLRRNVIVDAYSGTGAHSQGLFAYGVRGLLLEQNVFDHNGWSEAAPGGVGRATVYNHNAYLTSGTSGVVVKGNLFANAASHGLQARSGGDVLDNLFAANPLHLSYGLVRGDGEPTPGGVRGIVNGNVFLGTRDIAGQARGVGIEIANVRAKGPTIVSNNVFSNAAGNGGARDRGGFPAIMLVVGQGKNDAELAAGLRDLTIHGNLVRGWAAGLSLQRELRPGGGGTTGYSGLVVRQNEFSDIAGAVVDHPSEVDASAERWVGNRFDDRGGDGQRPRVHGRSLRVGDWANTPGYADADRSLAAYMAAHGGGGAANFFAQARSLSAAGGPAPASVAASPSVVLPLVVPSAVAYVRGGFEDPDSSAARRNWAPATPPTATAALPAVVRTDESTLTFTVTYRDEKAVDAASIDGGDVVLVGRGGREVPAELVGVDTGVDTGATGGDEGDGKTVTATYRVAAPAAVLRRKDRGTYRVKVVDEQVRDADGFAVEPGTAGEAVLEVTQVPPPPTVRKVKFYRGKRDLPDRLVIAVSADLAGVPAAADLQLTPVVAAAPAEVPADGAAAAAPPPVPLDLSAAAVSYDPERRTLTWTFPNLPAGQLPVGAYTLRLLPGGLAAADGKPLDGNGDGLVGDAFEMGKALKVKR